MPKYKSLRTGSPIADDDVGCPYAAWATDGQSRDFTWHPNGFRIFVPAAQLSASDEYAVADPYTVEENLSHPFHQRRFRITLNLLRQTLSPSSVAPRILDLGCGEGHLTAAMLRDQPTAEITGVDYSVSAIAYAQRHFPGIDWCVADAYCLPFASGYFNVVVCNNIWEHVPDPLRLLEGIEAVLANNGCLIISTPSRYRFGNLLRVAKGLPVAFMSRHHVTEYTVGQVIEQLRFGRFEVSGVVSDPIPPEHWRQRLVYNALSWWLRRVSSHHQLESTVFYLARRLGGE